MKPVNFSILLRFILYYIYMYPFDNCYTGGLSNVQLGGAASKHQIKSICIALVLILIAVYLIIRYTGKATPGCALKPRPNKRKNNRLNKRN
jgi:hypothetical protein